MKIMGKEQLEFAVFCIESFAQQYNIDSKKVYDAFHGGENILMNYIVKHYDVLHTQGKNYIVDDLKQVLDSKGIKIC